MKLKKWFTHYRIRTPRPHARKRRSRTETSNIRWVIDNITHIPCGHDGWSIGRPHRRHRLPLRTFRDGKALNITGDACVATVVARTEGELNHEA